MAQPQGNPKFPTTRWSRVAVAGDRVTPEAREALAELCAAYWYPIYTLIRRKGHESQEAFDLTQEYFARLLEKGVVAAAKRCRSTRRLRKTWPVRATRQLEPPPRLGPVRERMIQGRTTWPAARFERGLWNCCGRSSRKYLHSYRHENRGHPTRSTRF